MTVNGGDLDPIIGIVGIHPRVEDQQPPAVWLHFDDRLSGRRASYRARGLKAEDRYVELRLPQIAHRLPELPDPDRQSKSSD